jgi:hypothetical protein
LFKPKTRNINKAIQVVIVLLAFLTASTSLVAQSQHKRIASNLILEGRAYYGFLITHHTEMEIFQAHFPSFEFSLSKLTHGGARWEYMYNYPLVGISYFYSDLGRHPALGSAHALMPYINFPLTKNREFQLYLRTSLGLGYLTKSFHRLDNYKNVVIGSKLNAAVGLLVEFRKRIGEQFIVTGGIGLTHFSNGSMKTPNYGINIPAVNLGIAYRLSKENPYYKQKLLPELSPFEFDGKKSLDLDATVAFGYKNMESEIGGKYLVFAAFANLLKPVSFKSSFGAGIDVSYDGTDEELLKKEDIVLKNKFQLFQVGLCGTYALSLSKVSFIANLGFYVYSKYKGEGIIYEKIALQYHFNDHIFSNITLKAHAGRADYITLGVGYKFKLIYY